MLENIDGGTSGRPQNLSELISKNTVKTFNYFVKVVNIKAYSF